MIKRSAVAVSCLVFMCGSSARADLVPFDPADLKKDPPKAKNKEDSTKDKNAESKKAEESKAKAK